MLPCRLQAQLLEGRCILCPEAGAKRNYYLAAFIISILGGFMEYSGEFPILIIDDELRAESAEGSMSREIVRELVKSDFRVIEVLTAREGISAFLSHPHVSCVILDWDLPPDPQNGILTPADIITRIRERNARLPIFIYTSKFAISALPLEIITNIAGYIWKMEDTPDFIAGHVKRAARRYLDDVLPPFFRGLVEYVDESRYGWHTPGHMGGVAFLKTPAGRIFFQFFGENTLRADLSVSVPELGSLLRHTGTVGEAERRAAQIFGSDRTYFVTNGTSGANKIVWLACVTPGDIVLVDRNCHKSVMHAIILTGAVPVYLLPARNAFGIIGPIRSGELRAQAIRERIRDSPLTGGLSSGRAVLAAVTNSTYDGLCYNVEELGRQLSDLVTYLHFDEAWFGYAKFHPLYAGRYGMHPPAAEDPTVFATQSTHKVLAAFSQGSMIHIRQGTRPVDHQRFNESYMMFTSTSPQYSIIASLDVAAKMMADRSGKFLIEEALEEAIVFRKKMVTVGREIESGSGPDGQHWWFRPWQPDRISLSGRMVPFEEVDEDTLKESPDCWTLKPGDGWHGIAGIEEEYIMLDPIKVTLLTPGIDAEGKMEDRGIPASIVTKYLRSNGIVVEKTGFYSFLVLFTMGITKGKSGTLLAELFRFKALYDENSPLLEVFPDLVRDYPVRYAGLGLQDLCREMHDCLRQMDITAVISRMYERLPLAAMTPAAAYQRLVRGQVAEVPIREAEGRVSAVMVVPYPPGIPVLMPGEACTRETEAILSYLAHSEDFDNRYPGFENEVHGIAVREEDYRKTYCLQCIDGKD